MRHFAFLVLAAVVALGTGIAAADEWVIPQFKKPLPAATAIDVTTFVHPIKGFDGVEGGCVSIGNGTFQTCAHLFYTTPDQGRTWVKKPNGATGFCEINAGGTWRKAAFRIVDNSDPGDVAIVSIPEVSLGFVNVPAAKRRPPKYGERVLVYGLKRGYLQCGMIAGTREIALDANEKGTLNGDSGGGVFSEDGEFVGTIQGGDAAEPRVVKFRPNNFDINAAPVATKTPTKSASAAASSTPGMVCENGVCRLQQQAASGKQWKLKTGLLGRQYWVFE